MAFKARAEVIQQKYPRKWRHVKGIRQAVSRFGARAKNIIRDTVNQLAICIVNMALQKNSALAIEDLNKLNQKLQSFL